MEPKVMGGKIAKARKKINISQAQLAEQLFISPQAVGKWERGESVPDIVTMNRLAKILGTDLNYFSENFQSPDDEAVSKITNDNTGNSQQTVQEDTNHSNTQERQLLTNFSGSALADTDFAGVSAPNRKFVGSDLRGANFSGADLTGSSFIGSDVREAIFDGTNLTDCTLSALDLSDASFNGTIFVRTGFSASTLTGAKFRNAKLIDVKLTATDCKFRSNRPLYFA